MSTVIIPHRGLSLPRQHEQPARRRGATTWLAAGAFILMHVACLAAFLTGVSWPALALCGGVYLLQMVGITAGFHRYFSHRSYKTSRLFQFVLAWLGCSAGQRGPLWWAAQHRHHHRTSDTPEDLHSPITHTLWHSHVGWVLSAESDGTDEQAVKDLARYPELRWLDRFHWVPPLVLAVLCFLVGGWAGLVWGFFVACVLSHHATFTVNSVCHLWGRRRYATRDASRNNWLVALLTLGEGWHNNHHHYQSSAAQGFRWWEIDVSYYLLWLMAAVGLVWDVRRPPRARVADRAPPAWSRHLTRRLERVLLGATGKRIDRHTNPETNMTLATTIEQQSGMPETGSGESGHGLLDRMEAMEQGFKDGMHEVDDAVEATGRAARAAVRGTGDAFSWALDIPGHVARHPWLLVGAAVLVGLLIFRGRRQ